MLDQHQQLDLATILAYLKQAPTPVRAPGWESEGYWGRPICQSHIRSIPDSPLWQVLEEVRSPAEYDTVLRQYVATPLYLPYPANLAFRLRVDQGILDMNLPPGVDRAHAGGVNQFQLVRQKLQVVMTDTDVFYIEVLNTSGQAQVIASAVYGWHYYDPDGEISGTGESRVDAGDLAADLALRHFHG